MEIQFRTVLERNADLLLMRQFANNNESIIRLFLEKATLKYEKGTTEVLNVRHSVVTNDGESDIEVVLRIGNKKIALLIEDKIDAIAQENQADRYIVRGEKAANKGDYDEFFAFMVAPEKYLNHNAEAKKYRYQIALEDVRGALRDSFDIALIDQVLYDSKHGYIPVEDCRVTEFWKKLYDYIDHNYAGIFHVYGKKGEIRGSKAQWITIRTGKGTQIQIKSDRGFVDLEIAGYADKFQKFSKANQELLDQKQLFLRMASKSLAIRMYIDPIDFTKPFEEQKSKVEAGLQAADELQKLIKVLKF